MKYALAAIAGASGAIVLVAFMPEPTFFEQICTGIFVGTVTGSIFGRFF